MSSSSGHGLADGQNSCADTASDATGDLAANPPRGTQSGGTHTDTAANLPARHEAFLLAEGEKKVEVEPETRMCLS